MRDNKEKICEHHWELLFFQVIRINGSVIQLVDERHNYVTISSKLREYRLRGLITGDLCHTQLTESGTTYYNYLCKRLGKRGLYKYLMSDVLCRMSVDENDIYVPDK